MNPNIEMVDECLIEVFSFLNSLLDDEMELHSEINNAATSMDRLSFIEMHDMFQKQYETLDIIVQDVSKQVLMLEYFSKQASKSYDGLTNFDSN